jgi:hypothetical protein
MKISFNHTKITKTIFIGVFLTIIITPLILTILLPKSSTSIENRILAQKPSIQLIREGKFGEYIKDTAKYFEDSYQLKNNLIYVNSLIDYYGFNISPKDTVARGKNGWLFYTVEDGANIQDYYGEKLFSEKELETIATEISDIKTKLDKRDIQFIVMMAPNKHTIYEEYLPSRIRNQKGNRTRADQYGPILSSLDVNYIDLRKTLMDQKSQYSYPLYYPLDSHWNDRAGLIAYNKLLTKINPRPSTKTPDIAIGDQNRTGDLGNIVGLSNILRDTSISANIPSPPPYSTNITATKEIDRIITKNPSGDSRKILMFKDSFSGALLPFVSSQFSEVVYDASPKINLDLIDVYKPDLVILQFVERYSNILLQDGNKF